MRRLIAALVMATSLVAMTGCSTNSQTPEAQQAALEMSGSEVIASATGVETSQRLFDAAEVVVVSADSPPALSQAAHYAVAAGAPLLLAGDDADAEIARLGATRAITVGSVGPLPGGVDVIEPSEGTEEVLSVADVAGLDPGSASGVDGVEHTDHPLKMPTMLATERTSLPSVATARAAGAEVEVLSYPDPRVSSESMATVQEGDVIALGQEFGSQQHLATAIDLAKNGELPGGGGLVFPGRRMVAFYGHPSGGALGVMGEQGPEESVKRIQEHIANYQPLEEQPVVPAFEIIVTVASASPGDSGQYTNVGDPAEFVPYIDAITDAGGYAFLDLQPGRASLLEQAKVYEDLLKRPNVGLALDPEWKLGPEDTPLTQVGHVQAAEVNEVADWLAALVRDNNLPQKGLILHQFQNQMIRDREQIITDRPELAFILHADGHGSPGEKLDTWYAVQEGLGPGWFMAWKNFIDEDTPTFSPEQTYEVAPRPWFVSYQ
ncbi:cell wall-binding repeat-containing protein [Corynebacterium testudinoris]|uniref:Lipoprotein n=1 Tax=Corynebacterium testudinoris TaxID=136857 RepID=A0A0G3H730_9CORY|nr:hypothetical protein [Corynebacterium testudinoris]AKK08595.1 hypothetical protein CTEST_05745 [Corynebacterium testudinoris]MBX8997012.1 cell wall-binding repeat-containing protein [Corynebacterium testudinoris]